MSTINSLTRDQASFLKDVATDLRVSLLRTSHSAKIPHLGSCLSCIDILTHLYWQEMNIDIENFDDGSCDRFILSKGHAAPALLQVLAFKGFYSKERIDEFGRDGTFFHEHPPATGLLRGVEAATGSLGHGFPIGIGIGLAALIKGKGSRIYVLLGDGECNEGVIWEGAMFASANLLSNITVIVDMNKWQATGRSTEVMNLSGLLKMWGAFGWHAVEADGHDFFQLEEAFKKCRQVIDRPSVIIANTIKGKGVSFMEDNNNWHYKTPSDNELALALKELEVGQ